ncbi:ComF family protein [bacterium 1XD21-13]|nr:ComF family protein [bacterium 1XD21-13]
MKRSKNVIRVFPRLFDLIYPRRCPVCDDIVGGRALICEPCRLRLHPVGEPLCKKCGKPLSTAEAEYCPDCGRKKHLYVRGRAALEYDSVMRESIGRFKYKNRREYGDFYVQELLRACGEAVRSWNPDLLIPIPLHKSRRRKRGFNQAELIARGLGKELGIPVSADSLLRTKKTSPQKELNDQERKSNLKNAFQLAKDNVKFKKILLIDDIYTTGSTIDAAASVLLDHGAEKVYFLCISIGRGY